MEEPLVEKISFSVSFLKEPLVLIPSDELDGFRIDRLKHAIQFTLIGFNLWLDEIKKNNNEWK